MSFGDFDKLIILNIAKYLGLGDIAALRLNKKLNKYLTPLITQILSTKKIFYTNYLTCPWQDRIDHLEIELTESINLNKKLTTLNLIPTQSPIQHHNILGEIHTLNIFSITTPQLHYFNIKNVTVLDVDVISYITILPQNLVILNVGRHVCLEEQIVPRSVKRIKWQTETSNRVYLDHLVESLEIENGADLILDPKIYRMLRDENCYHIDNYYAAICELIYTQDFHYQDEHKSYRWHINFSCFVRLTDDIYDVLYSRIGVY